MFCKTIVTQALCAAPMTCYLFFIYLFLMLGKNAIPAVDFESHLRCGLWYTGSSVAAKQRKVKAAQEQ